MFGFPSFSARWKSAFDALPPPDCDDGKGEATGGEAEYDFLFDPLSLPSSDRSRAPSSAQDAKGGRASSAATTPGDGDGEVGDRCYAAFMNGTFMNGTRGAGSDSNNNSRSSGNNSGDSSGSSSTCSSSLASPLSSIPGDCAYLVLTFLPPASLLSLRATCSFFKSQCSRWDVWSSLFGCTLRHLSGRIRRGAAAGNHDDDPFLLYAMYMPLPQTIQSFPSPLVSTTRLPTKSTSIKYSGKVGVSDRAVRTVTPFPSRADVFGRRRMYSNADDRRPSRHNGNFPARVTEAFRKALRNATFWRKKSSPPCPHPSTPSRAAFSQLAYLQGRISFPYITGASARIKFRRWCYYEVTILPQSKTCATGVGEEEEEEEEEVSVDDNGNPNDANPPPPCVAIGLSKSNFNSTCKMPGWDDSSYGYHSDDGGIFHGDGDMIRKFERWSAGDTVGCGVCHVPSTSAVGGGGGGSGSKNLKTCVFFTSCSSGLMHAEVYPSIDSRDRLYPCVGIDAADDVRVNLGNEGFRFDERVIDEELGRRGFL